MEEGGALPPLSFRRPWRCNNITSSKSLQINTGLLTPFHSHLAGFDAAVGEGLAAAAATGGHSPQQLPEQAEEEPHEESGRHTRGHHHVGGPPPGVVSIGSD